MPNWGDNEGRYWWTAPDGREVQIPHAPVSFHKNCRCACCNHQRKEKGEKLLPSKKEEIRALKLEVFALTAERQLIWEAAGCPMPREKLVDYVFALRKTQEQYKQRALDAEERIKDYLGQSNDLPI